jgi:hypothetical protein
MRTNRYLLASSLVLAASLLFATPDSGFAQGRDGGPDRDGGLSEVLTASISLSPDIRVLIKDFYSSRKPVGAEALPPGIRKRLARGKPLPPGIAKNFLPGDLRSRIEIPRGYEIIEVGLDVLLVEVATNIVHDVLMDVVR